MGTKTRNFDVVAKEIGVLRDFIHRAAKELLLIIKARTPGEIGADLQVLPDAVAEHVGRMHAFGRLDVMSAAGGVNVMVARPPTELRRINPAFDLEAGALQLPGDDDRLLAGDRFRPARKLHRVAPLWQTHRFPISPIDLRMKREVRRQPLGLGRIDALLRVAD